MEKLRVHLDTTVGKPLGGVMQIESAAMAISGIVDLNDCQPHSVWSPGIVSPMDAFER
jgi:hypothetical protein